MKKFTLFASAILIWFGGATLASSQPHRIEKGNWAIEGIPDIPQRIMDRRLQYENIRSAHLYGWNSKGGGILIATRFGETSQVHWVQTPGGTRHQITFFNEPVGSASINPDPSKEGFLFQKDVGGSEIYQLYYFDMESGKYWMVTDGESRNGSGLWSNRGDRFAFYSTKRNGRDWDLYMGDFSNPQNAVAVLESTGSWIPVDWSPDDTQLLVTRYVSASESYYYVLDLKNRELREINPSAEKIAYGDAKWSKDGRGIYFISDEGGEFQQLMFYDLKTQEISNLTQKIPWDVEEFDLSGDGRWIAFVTNEEGISKLHILNWKNGKEMEFPEIPIGQIYALKFSPDGSQLGVVLNTPKTPGDVYVLEFKKEKLIRWTKSEVGGLVTEKFVTPQLIHYETFDGRRIPAFYYRPEDRGKEPLPVLIQIHGGPEIQYRPYFNSSLQYYVNELRIAVLAPNVRGSSGYGKSYLTLDNGIMREDAVKDIGKLLDWIEQEPGLDSRRVAVMGSSYGGYMVLASMVHFNDRIRAGIDIVGISNFVTFLENTTEYRRDLRRVEYGDERVPVMREFLMKISPTTNARRITNPLFIAQGLNDPRVPASESEQILESIRSNGGIAWYLLAKDEGHGFDQKRNRDFFNSASVLFLEKFLQVQNGRAN